MSTTAPSEPMQARVDELVSREKLGGLTTDETAELDRYAELEHEMRMAKARTGE